MNALEKASRILTTLGFAQEPSMEPGADERRDRVAVALADIVLRHDHEQVLSLLETASDYVRAYKCQCNPMWTREEAGKLLRQIDNALAGRDPVTPNDRVEGRDAALSRRVPSHDGLEGT